jgi:hypothetical protein
MNVYKKKKKKKKLRKSFVSLLNVQNTYINDGPATILGEMSKEILHVK